MSRWIRAFSRLRHVGFAVRLAWDAARKWTLAWFVLIVLQGVIPAALVWITKEVVDGVAGAIGGGVSLDAAMPVLVPGGILAVLVVTLSILGSISEWVSTAQAELVSDHVKHLIHERAVAADYGFYESDLYYDRLSQVNSDAASRTLQMLQSLGGILRSTVTLLAVGGILLSYNAVVPVALVVSTLPAFWVVLRHNQIYHAWWDRATSRRRRVSYYDQMLTQDRSAQEVRIFDLGDHFRSLYRSLRRELFTERVDLFRRQIVARFFAALTALAITAGALAWVGLRALNGAATIGDLALFYQAFVQGQGVVTQLLQNAGQLYTHTLFLEHLHEFLGQTDEVLDPPHPKPFPKPIQQGVQFDDVTFAYPGTERNALESFSLHIPAGKVTAIVGENGAGKSTFIKLLCRFYDPSSGRVTVDGVDLRSFAQADIRRNTSVMFQRPVRYQMTVAENIRLGDRGASAGGPALRRAAEGGGADEVVAKMPLGYDTLLGRMFEGGTELSGGEWQRIALSRAFLRDAQLVILDEPTSAMDSWMENDWLSRFRRMVRGRTALVITHRFTTAMRADIIHVVEGGRIVESGTHAELVGQGGRYAASWTAQVEQARHQETAA